MAKITTRKIFMDLKYVQGVIEDLVFRLRGHKSDELETLEIARLLIKSLNDGIDPAIEVLKSDITPFMLMDK